MTVSTRKKAVEEPFIVNNKNVNSVGSVYLFGSTQPWKRDLNNIAITILFHTTRSSRPGLKCKYINAFHICVSSIRIPCFYIYTLRGAQAAS